MDVKNTDYVTQKIGINPELQIDKKNKMAKEHFTNHLVTLKKLSIFKHDKMLYLALIIII